MEEYHGMVTMFVGGYLEDFILLDWKFMMMQFQHCLGMEFLGWSCCWGMYGRCEL
ncbi:hypothetical protein [Lentibacillus sp. Marseille-P4043]|uniref:hypothetical protein n=1 Tax=Lentibacillus sp. Marseille-P4043 TaxID=2040293 RepID=UPI00131A538B|nr:hypothetical protein [Lentibacillus sp. Marseille-P4043]